MNEQGIHLDDGVMLDTTGVAMALGCSAPTAQRLIRSGQLPSFKIGRLRRVRPEDLRAYVDRKDALAARRSFMARASQLEREALALEAALPVLSEEEQRVRIIRLRASVDQLAAEA